MYSEEFKHKIIDCATYFVENKSTVRLTAKEFRISKTTVHIYLTEKLYKINRSLYEEARKILNVNKAERHIRGGNSTKKKFELLKNS